MDYQSILFGDIYYNSTDLRYNNQYKYFFSNKQLNEYKQFKLDLIEKSNKNIKALNLKSFNSKYLYYVNGKCLLSLIKDYLQIVLNDLNETHSTIVSRNYSDILYARIYSEVEGTLNVENVPTTRTRIDQIRKGASLNSKNDIIIKNMLNGFQFIFETPIFNKNNLHKLYCILSNGCLEPDQELNGSYYRNDAVYIDNYEGCPIGLIEECMNSLFDFVNINLHIDQFQALLPHICHYYILYIHPYFDFNGRTARMVSLWISLLTGKESFLPLYMGEAINDNKNQYYEALTETRNMDNDISYFLIYVMNTAINYSLTYRNLEYISVELMKKGITLSSLEKVYIKKLILKAKTDSFDYKRFLKYANVDISKQAALKALNKLEEYGILSSFINDKKVKLFNIKDKMIKYKISSQEETV